MMPNNKSAIRKRDMLLKVMKTVLHLVDKSETQLPVFFEYIQNDKATANPAIGNSHHSDMSELNFIRPRKYKRIMNCIVWIDKW